VTSSVDDFLLFFEVARAGTLTAAARRLDIPKSTVSRRLLQFEGSLGVRLFHKTTRKVTLTALGETYLQHCDRVVHEIEEARGFLESMTSKPAGVLRVTMPTDVGIHWLAGFFVAFARRHPDVRLSLDFTGRRVDLVGERFDVGIRAGALTGSEMVVRKLFSWTWLLFSSPGYLREAGTPHEPADLANHRFVVLEAHFHPRTEFDLLNGQRVERIALPATVVTNSLGTLKAMILAGGGIGLMPYRIAREHIENRRLVRVLPRWQSKPLDFFYLISSRKLLPAKTRLFVDEMIQYFRELECEAGENPEPRKSRRAQRKSRRPA
jgi:DNA-binding transcriptional LysR family regulator